MLLALRNALYLHVIAMSIYTWSTWSVCLVGGPPGRLCSPHFAPLSLAFWGFQEGSDPYVCMYVKNEAFFRQEKAWFHGAREIRSSQSDAVLKQKQCGDVHRIYPQSLNFYRFYLSSHT